MWFGWGAEAGGASRLEQQYEDLVLMIRILKKQSDKSFKQQKTYRRKAKDAVEIGDLDRASIYAQQSISHKGLSLKYLNLSLRMELVSSMAQSALATGKVTESITNILSTVTSIADPVLVARSVEKFERTFDALSITDNLLTNGLDQTTGLLVPGQTREVSELLETLRSESALHVLRQLPTTTFLDGAKEKSKCRLDAM
jgi:hypothetical protein